MSDIQPIVLAPGEGRRIPGPEGLTVKAVASNTNGSIGVLEATSEPGFAAPQHIHHHTDELFYVLEGRFEFLVGDERIPASPGTFLFVPRGTVHSPRAVGPEPGKVLIGMVPGGAEGAFDDMAALAAANGGPPEPDDERLRAIVERYDSTIVGPPPDIVEGAP